MNNKIKFKELLKTILKSQRVMIISHDKKSTSLKIEFKGRLDKFDSDNTLESLGDYNVLVVGIINDHLVIDIMEGVNLK